MPLLGSDGGAGSFEITLWLDRLIDAAERDGMFTLLIELDAPAACAPEWAARATRFVVVLPGTARGSCAAAAGQGIADTCGLAPAIVPPTAEPDALLGDISAQWAMRDLVVAPPASLSFSYSTGAGTWKALPADALVDGTAACGARACGASAFRPTGRRPARPWTAWCPTCCGSNANRLTTRRRRC